MKLLLLLFISITLLSCEKKSCSELSSRVITIKYSAGKHRVLNRSVWDFLDLLECKQSVDDYHVIFSYKSRYLIPAGTGAGVYYKGWNKIGGTFNPTLDLNTSFGMHDNSHRMVWRYNPEDTTYEIAEYYYRNGVRGWDIMQSNIKEGDTATFYNFKKLHKSEARPYFGGVYTYKNDVKIRMW
jgi:hypothetical protein